MTYELTADEVHHLRDLLAEDAIRKTKVLYSQLMDAGRIEELAELFTEDAVCVFGRFGEWHGRIEIRTKPRSSRPRPPSESSVSRDACDHRSLG